MTKEIPLMHKGVLRGHVTEENGEKLEMSVHLDITTGWLLDNCEKIEKQGDHYEIVM